MIKLWQNLNLTGKLIAIAYRLTFALDDVDGGLDRLEGYNKMWQKARMNRCRLWMHCPVALWWRTIWKPWLNTILNKADVDGDCIGDSSNCIDILGSSAIASIYPASCQSSAWFQDCNLETYWCSYNGVENNNNNGIFGAQTTARQSMRMKRCGSDKNLVHCKLARTTIDYGARSKQKNNWG